MKALVFLMPIASMAVSHMVYGGASIKLTNRSILEVTHSSSTLVMDDLTTDSLEF